MGIFKRHRLRPNCLLTRYPICFAGGKKTWNKIASYLAAHGYDVSVIPRRKKIVKALTEKAARHGKVHLVTDRESAVDALLIAGWMNGVPLSSVTMKDPEFFESPEYRTVLADFKKPEGVMFGSILTENPEPAAFTEASRRLAKSLGPVFMQVLGRGDDRGMYLDLCIFLAEYDLTHAK